MTFNKLLVPLDGSHLAESVLPLVGHLAQAFKSQVLLLHIIERGASPTVHGERHLVSESEALAYLDEISQRLPSDVVIEKHVHTTAESDVAASIVQHSQELKADLVVMCTHGRSGLQTRLFGGIAQHVLSRGNIPVMLTSPQKTSPTEAFSCQRILVPLDGNKEHEAGLETAVSLATVCGAALHLVGVIHELHTLPAEKTASAILLPIATHEMLEQSSRQMAQYLSYLVQEIRLQKLNVTAEIQRGDPTEKIVQTARQQKVDLIVLGTHGKTPMEAFWSGSLTPALFVQSQVPILLVPVLT
jgi:nucleotide-binding universal stress UspA family protein